MNAFSRISTVTLVIALSAPGVFAQRLSESTGLSVFQNSCTSCHGANPVEHAPSEATLKTMSPESIYDAITTGVMKNMAASLNDNDKRLIAEYLGGRKLDKDDAGDIRSEEHTSELQSLRHLV